MENEWAGSLVKEMAELRDTIKDDMEPEAESRDEEEKEEEDEEYSESLEEDLKEYQERFRKYVESLKNDLPKLYEPGWAKEKKITYKTTKEKETIKSPWERGHKLGCSCPGCTRYREVNGINLENLGQNIDLKFSNISFASKRSDKIEDYKESRRPCGGKYYHFFHGKRSEFKRLLGDYSKKLNLNLAGY